MEEGSKSYHMNFFILRSVCVCVCVCLEGKTVTKSSPYHRREEKSVYHEVVMIVNVF